MKKLFELELDEISELIFYELEKISDGTRGHFCCIEAESKEEAVDKLCDRLRPFFKEYFEEICTQ